MSEVACLPVVFTVLLDLWIHPSVSCRHGSGVSSADTLCGGRWSFTSQVSENQGCQAGMNVSCLSRCGSCHGTFSDAAS